MAVIKHNISGNFEVPLFYYWYDFSIAPYFNGGFMLGCIS